MPTITLLGWIHTILGIVSIILGFYLIIKSGFIQSRSNIGKSYLLCTLITALTSLGIFHQGGFNIAHLLAVLTLIAISLGALAERYQLFGKFSKYIQASCYSGTLLFHMIPAITDSLRRLPIDSPIVNDMNDPLLLNFYICFQVGFLIILTLQFRSIKKQS